MEGLKLQTTTDLRSLLFLLGMFFLTTGNVEAQIVTPDCDNAYNLCTGDAVKLEPNDPTGLTNFVWYANSVAPANEIDATTAASFFVNAAHAQTDFATGKIVVTRAASGDPVAAPTSITYILTAEYTASPGGCATIVNEVEVTFLPVPSLSSTPITICTASPGGQSVDLETLITDDSLTTGTVTFYESQADAEAEMDAIASTVNPGSTTTYWARKNTTATDLNADGCFDIVSVTVTVECLSVGNQVWYDTNNDGGKDMDEDGIEGVNVNLYLDANGNGAIEDNSGSGGVNETTAIATDNTGADGLYAFENLKAGTYFVGIPSGELGSGGTLESLFSSGTTRAADGTISETGAPDPDATPTDSDDNGEKQSAGFFSGGVLSDGFDLAYGTEPTGENPDNSSNPADNNDNQTIDFGFYGMSIGSLVFMDVANNGVFDSGTDMGIAATTVRLYTADGTTLLATTTTGADGRYLFVNLPAGNYIVAVVTPAGKSSSDSPVADANLADDDNNGTTVSGLETRSDVFSLSPGAGPENETDRTQAEAGGAGMGATPVNDNANTPDNNSNLHVDFGFKNDCPTVVNPSADQTICANGTGGTAGTNITVETSQNDANSIRFVRFAAAQTGDDMYSGGTNLATVTPAGGAAPYTATYTFNPADFPNATNAPITYYVYAVLNPTPVGPTCRPFQEIEITVNPLPTADPASLTLCETTAGGGTAIFTLSNANATVLNGQTGMTVTYHDNLTDAQNDANAITTKTAADGATVVARVETTSGCYATSTITLNVNDKPQFTLSLPDACPGNNPTVQITLGLNTGADPDVAVNGGGAFAYSTLTGGLLTTTNGIMVNASNSVVLTNDDACSNSQTITTPAVVAQVCVPVKITKL